MAPVDFPSLLRLAEAVKVDASSGLLWTYRASRQVGGETISVAAWTLRGGTSAYYFCDYPPDIEATLGPPTSRDGYTNIRNLPADPAEAIRQCLLAVDATPAIVVEGYTLSPHEVATARRTYVEQGSIATIKYVRSLNRCGLKEARDAVMEGPLIPESTRAEARPRSSSRLTDAQERAVIVTWLRGLAVVARRVQPEREGWYLGVAADLEQGNVTLERLRKEAGGLQ